MLFPPLIFHAKEIIMPIRGKAFAGTPEDAALMQPWITPARLNTRGANLGIDARSGRAFWFDPWDLMTRRIITGLLFLTIGVRDSGKSALMIKIILQLMLRQAGQIDGTPQEMTARITTRKPMLGHEAEMKPLNDYLYGNFVDMNRKGFINIFDPGMLMTEWDLFETAVNICELANNDIRLTGFQPLVLQVAVYRMLSQYSVIASPELLEIVVRGLTEDDVDAYFKNSNSLVLQTLKSTLDENPALLRQLQLEMNKPYALPKNEFEHDKMFVAQQLGRILRGDFGQVFGGVNSLRGVLSDPVTTLNMTGLSLKARALIESMLWKWSTIALTNNRPEMIPGINVADEEHEGVNSLMYMRYWAAYTAKARAFRTFDLRATQFLRQIATAGSADSEIRSLALQILDGVGGYFIGAQRAENESALQDISRLGISDGDLEWLCYSGDTPAPGKFLLKVPGRPTQAFQSLLTPTELRLSQTNQATEGMMQFNPQALLDRAANLTALVGSVNYG
jgi:hypothetical protein